MRKNKIGDAGGREPCVVCHKIRNAAADLVFNALLMGTSYQYALVVKHPVCRHCMRRFGMDEPQVHLTSRGLAKRLTPRQVEAAGRALGRRLRKMQDES